MSDITPWGAQPPTHVTRRQASQLQALQFNGLVDAKRIELNVGKAGLALTGLSMATSLAIDRQEQLDAQAILAAQRTPSCAGRQLAILDTANREMTQVIQSLGRKIR